MEQPTIHQKLANKSIEIFKKDLSNDILSHYLGPQFVEIPEFLWWRLIKAEAKTNFLERSHPSINNLEDLYVFNLLRHYYECKAPKKTYKILANKELFEKGNSVKGLLDTRMYRCINGVMGIIQNDMAISDQELMEWIDEYEKLHSSLLENLKEIKNYKEEVETYVKSMEKI